MSFDLEFYNGMLLHLKFGLIVFVIMFLGIIVYTLLKKKEAKG